MPPKKMVGQSKGRPAFVGKLWQMVNDPANDPYIRWMPDGKSIQVVNREQFEKTLLPKYFKHANFSSFVRQLNMYGWHKVQDLSSGSMHNGDENWQFQSPNFIKGHEELLDRIVRNKGHPKQEQEEDEQQDLQRVLRELEAIKTKQMVIGEDLFRIRKDNEMLWNEVHSSREKYDQHSQLLDKILHFLASVYGQNSGKILDSMMGPSPGSKRRFITQPPLDDSPSSDGIERIQEIREMKDLQDKFKEGGPVGHDAVDPLDSAHALVPFNRRIAGKGPASGPAGSALGAGNSAPSSHNTTPMVGSSQGATPLTPHLQSPHLQSPLPQTPQNQLDNLGKDPLEQQIATSQADIDHLANQMSMQDLSLQQVQDWIQKLNNDEFPMEDTPASSDNASGTASDLPPDLAPDLAGASTVDTPIDFDVDDFLNSDIDDTTIKEEDLAAR